MTRRESSFTVSAIARGCSQRSKYGHILTFRRGSGWFACGCGMTSLIALQRCCRANRAIRGRRAKDNRLFVEAVLWVARTGSPWRDLPSELGEWNSTYQRFARWSNKGVWQRVFAELAKDADFEEVFLDTTIIRAHQHAAGAPKKGPQALGRSRGGLSTKIHALVEGLGQLARFALTPGQAGDITEAYALLQDVPPRRWWPIPRSMQQTCDRRWLPALSRRSYPPIRRARRNKNSIDISIGTAISSNVGLLASNISVASPLATTNSLRASHRSSR